MAVDTQFLSDLPARRWLPPAQHGFRPAGLFLGQGAHGLEVAAARSANAPARSSVLECWKTRKGGRAAPVLLVVLHPGGAALCGPAGETPPVHQELDPGQVERLCRETLAQPDRHAALRFLSQALPSLETALPGLNNEGLLALHELQHGAPERADWPEAKRRARRALGTRDRDLLRALGFRIEHLDNLTSLLRSGDRRTALAVMLRDTESPEAGTDRFNGLSPISYGLKKADDENLPWVVLVQGDRLRLYATAVEAGVGRRGRTETYIECQPALLSDDHLPYLWLLFSAEALAPDGSLGQVLEESRRFAGRLAERLRERIYEQVVPALAQGVSTVRRTADAGRGSLGQTYEMALIVLFRLLFIAYAEDRDLLPYRYNDVYRRRSLKQKAQELATCVEHETPIAAGDSHWGEFELLCKAVATGNAEWGVPAYDGGLFTGDPDVSPNGAAIAAITLSNESFEAALRHLLVMDTAEGVPGPVDFRSLGVREFGTIYEGLLESELGVAETDLALDTKGVYRPASPRDAVAVAAGETYLHNRSGARKSSGSYYTKSFAVEHLLEGALEPAMDDHFARLRAMDEADAADAFFDFRVADIAMGSGHFLIAAVDRIEKRMADALAARSFPGVRLELDALRGAALAALGELAASTTIEDGPLLRRLIARRCIYGVDLNGLSVQLARLAVWIHSFVPGLPLSFLDHNLVHGNSLVGVGTIDEIRKKFEDLDALPLFPLDAGSLLGRAAAPLRRLANLNDATLADIRAARAARREAGLAIRSTETLCDLIAAQPIADTPSPITQEDLGKWDPGLEDGGFGAAVHSARRALDGLHALHFPVAFPEVFLGERPGFDVILGNPPWQEATIEEHAFWARHFPGLRSQPQRTQEMEKARLRGERPDLVSLYEAELSEAERIRRALVGGEYPGMGTGDPDFYKAFCWRFWRLAARNGGHIGVVLPRSALAAKGSTDFRLTMLGRSAEVDVTMLVNNRQWVFPDVHPQYSIGLVVVVRRAGDEEMKLRLRGPYSDLRRFQANVVREPVSFCRADVLKWNDSASLPLLPHQDSVEVFAQLRKAPRLDLSASGQWRARPDSELHATAHKPLMDLESQDPPDGFWPVYKGESFDLWNPDTGTYYAWADPEPALRWIQAKRLRAGKGKRDSPHREFAADHIRDPSSLPCYRPRVAFRDVSRATDSRTVRVALVPPNVFIGNQAPYFLWPRGNPEDQAFLLGVLSSVPLDWYARRFVETHVSYFVLNPFPIPRPSRDDGRWQRVVSLAGRLACPDDRFLAWANIVGVGCGLLASDEKEDMVHELDAVVAHLYGLTEVQLVHVFETFHEGWDYQDRLDGVLAHFRDWRGRG